MDKFYESRLYFVKAKEISNISKIHDIVRANPDGLEMMWVWDHPEATNPIWVNAVFDIIDNESYRKNKLRKVRYIALPLNRQIKKINKDKNGKKTIIYKHKKYKVIVEKGQPKVINIEDASEFNHFFRITNNNYHPNEITAEYFRIYILNLIGKYNNQHIMDGEGMKSFISMVESI
tara:strand:- start:287 stop:814 length:528 start_codon:yes stop_codon:yes gene_type:complete